MKLRQGDFDSQNAWYREWDFTPELLFVPPKPPTIKGNGLGIGALFGLILSIGSLIGLVHEDLKQKDGCIAMPEHWQFKVEGHRPQLVVQCAEMREDDTLGSAKYVVTIPHYQLTKENPPPPFRYMFKGKYYGVLKLNDNSKIQVYCDSEIEAKRVLNSIALWVDPSQTFQTYVRTGEISNPLFKNVKVYPKYATFYSKGTHPDSEVTRIYWGKALK